MSAFAIERSPLAPALNTTSIPTTASLWESAASCVVRATEIITTTFCQYLQGSTPVTAAPTVAPPQSPTISTELQWTRVTSIVASTNDRQLAAVELHATAAQRLDSIEYELGLLQRDLAGVLAKREPPAFAAPKLIALKSLPATPMRLAA